MKILIKNIHSLDISCLLTNVKPDFIDIIRWKKIQSLKMEKDKVRSLTSGYLLYKMCKELEIEKPQYEYGENGKPYIVGRERLAFNLSHSGDYAVLVYDEICNAAENFRLSAGCAALHAVGVDIQQIRPLHERMKIRILHENEQIPAGLSAEEETAYLNRMWAIKESYVKMTGDGLALDFRKIYIDFERMSISTENGTNAFFTEYDRLPGYVMTVCAAKEMNEKGVYYVIQ